MTREESIKFWEKLARGKGVWGGGANLALMIRDTGRKKIGYNS